MTSCAPTRDLVHGADLPLWPAGRGSGAWVLVADSGSGQNRSALAAVRALAVAGYRPAVTVSGRPGIAAVSRHCQRVVPTPPVGTPGFVAAVRAETASHAYLGVMPASDAALVALSAPGADLVDKAKLALRAAQVGMRIPPNRTFDTVESLVAAASELEYPLVVKPSLKTSVAHRPARRIVSPTDLAQLSGAAGPLIVQPYIGGEMHSLAGVMWQGRLMAPLHQRHLRIWPRTCGDACAAITTPPDETLQHRVQRLLAGYDGVFQAEFVGDHLLDINPRMYGSLPLALAAGVNLVGLYWDLVRGCSVRPAAPRLGVRFNWWEGDVRHVLSGWRDGHFTTVDAARALHSVAGSSAVREILDDPRPLVARMRYACATRRARSNPHAVGARVTQ